MSDEKFTDEWHADDCPGYPTCDGCGYIAADMAWYPGPCPPADHQHQTARSEHGVRYIWEGAA